MTGLGIHFEGHLQQNLDHGNRISRMARTRSMPVFQDGSSRQHAVQAQYNQIRYDESTSHPYVPSEAAYQASETTTHVSGSDGHSQQHAAPISPSKNVSLTPHIRLHSYDVHSRNFVPHHPSFANLSPNPLATSPEFESSHINPNDVGPGMLFQRRLAKAKARVAQQEANVCDQHMRQAQSMDGMYEGYLGAGMMAAAMRPTHAPPSLDLLRALAIRNNSPRSNSPRSNGTPALSSASSPFQTRPPNSPSRLPAFLQHRQNRDGLSPMSASPHTLPSAPSSPLNPRRFDTPHSAGPLGFQLQLPPANRDMMQRVKSKAQTTQNLTKHRTMRSMNDLTSIYNRDQLHHHFSQHQRHQTISQVPSTRQDQIETWRVEPDIHYKAERMKPTRTWTVENLFDCPDLTRSSIVPDTSKLIYQPSDPRSFQQQSQTAINSGRSNVPFPSHQDENVVVHHISDRHKKVSHPFHQPINKTSEAHPSAQTKNRTYEGSHGTVQHVGNNEKYDSAEKANFTRPRKHSAQVEACRRETETHTMRRSRSEATGLNTSYSLSRRSTLMSVGGDSLQRSRDLSRILAPSERSVSNIDAKDDEGRSVRTSRPSTACSNYPYEEGRTYRSVAKDVEHETVSLEGAKSAKKARVELDLMVESSLIVEGGTLTGRIEVKVPGNDGSSRKKNGEGSVWIGEPKIRIIGFEELSTGSSRHVFYHYPVKIPMDERKKSKSSLNLLAVVDPLDEEGYRQARGGVHAFPFKIRLPIGQGAKGSWKGKQGTVRYIVIGSIRLKSSSGSDRSIAHFYRHVEFYPYFDHAQALARSPQVLKATTSKALFMGGQGKVHLTMKLHRSTWVAGQRCHVEVHVSNDGTKKVKNLALSLMRTTTVFRNNKKSSDSDSESESESEQGNDSALKHPDFCSTQTTKKKIAESVLTVGKKGHQGLVTAKGLWMGVDKSEDVAFSHFLVIPPEALTITRGKRLEVTYAIRASVGGSLSSDVSVEIPIKIINFVSIDPPPGHIAFATEGDAIPPSHAPDSTSSQKMQTAHSKNDLKHLRARSHQNNLMLPSHQMADQEELRLFMGSSRFPEDDFPETLDQMIMDLTQVDQPGHRFQNNVQPSHHHPQSHQYPHPEERSQVSRKQYCDPHPVQNPPSSVIIQKSASKVSGHGTKSSQAQNVYEHLNRDPAKPYAVQLARLPSHQSDGYLSTYMDRSAADSKASYTRIIHEFPAPPQSHPLVVYQKSRFENWPPADAKIYQSGHRRDHSRSRCASSRNAKTAPNDQASSQHMVHIVSSSSNDSGHSETYSQPGYKSRF